MDAVSAWAKEQPGFISRDLSYSPDAGKYVESVYWESLEQAIQAAQAAESDEACSPMFSKIRFEGVQFMHTQPLIEPVHA